MLKRVTASPWLIFAVALATRLLSSSFILRNYFGPQLLFIENEPSHIASALASGFGFSSPYANVPIAPTAQQPPVYPAILALIFKLFGNYSSASAYVAVGVNILAGAFTAVLLYHTGELYFNKTLGAVAAWVWALPWMYRAIAFSVSLSGAHLAALGLVASVLLLPKAVDANRGSFGLGLFLGLLGLLQPSFLAVWAIYMVWLALWKRRFRQTMLVFSGVVIVLAPWTVRNYVALHRLVPLRDNFGLELWLGNRPGMQGTVDYLGDFPDHDPSTFSRLGETGYMDSKFEEATMFIESHPKQFAGRCLRRIIEFWYVPYSQSWLLVSLLAWIGTFLACRRQTWGALLAIPLATFPVVYYVTHVFPTYRLPIEPLVILLATFSVVELIAFVRVQCAS